MFERYSTYTALTVILLLPSIGRAQEGEEPITNEPVCDTSPWEEGVSAEHKQLAQRLYRDGNALLDANEYYQAGIKYREALKYWDNPLIHFNLMLAMIGDHEQVDAYKSSVAALRYDGCALDEGQRRRAFRHQQALTQSIATLKITCDVPGAHVFLDGQEIFTAPGEKTEIVLYGRHVLKMTKSGVNTYKQDVTLRPGQRATAKLFVRDRQSQEQQRETGPRESQEPETRRRWSLWLPVSFAVSGLIGGVVGASLYYRGSQDPDRCSWCKTTGTGLVLVGSALLVTGIVLTIFNKDVPKAQARRDLAIQPQWAPGYAGAAVVGHF